jgi:hypothetical protein
LKKPEGEGVIITFGKNKAGRKPKISDAQIATLFILSFITNTPVLKPA